MEGVDYSFARPSPAGLAAAGKRFAARYVGTQRSDKNLTAGEVEQLLAAAVDVVAAYERTEGFMITDDGASAALRAFTDATKCGMPNHRPIYFCLDVDPARLGPAEWLRVERFLEGAASPRGPELVGVYGAYAAIERLVGDHAHWGWQTYGWSHGQWSPKAQLLQYRNGVPLAGGLVDFDRSTTTDFGQWSHTPRSDAMTPEDRAWIEGRLGRLAQYLTTGSGNTMVNADRDGWGFVDDAGVNTLARIAGLIKGIDLDVDETALAAQLLTRLTPQAIADAIVQVLPDPGDARSFLDQMAARLAS